MTEVNSAVVTHRQRQAQETRSRVVAAARRLFVARGYAGTTIQSIAEEAGVAVPTVYGAFGSKRGILEGARVAMLAESEIPKLIREAIKEADPGRKLDLAARWVRQQMERSSDVIRAFREGSRFDEAVAKDHRRILDNRSRNLLRFIKSLESSLTPGMSAQTATDLLWTFSNEELYRELVAERGWSPDRFEQWLAQTLRVQLLGEHAKHTSSLWTGP
jgi:AcrR family transcriptional regulator